MCKMVDTICMIYLMFAKKNFRQGGVSPLPTVRFEVVSITEYQVVDFEDDYE
jgi:hypothetical protein